MCLSETDLCEGNLPTHLKDGASGATVGPLSSNEFLMWANIMARSRVDTVLAGFSYKNVLH